MITECKIFLLQEAKFLFIYYFLWYCQNGTGSSCFCFSLYVLIVRIKKIHTQVGWCTYKYKRTKKWMYIYLFCMFLFSLSISQALLVNLLISVSMLSLLSSIFRHANREKWNLIRTGNGKTRLARGWRVLGQSATIDLIKIMQMWSDPQLVLGGATVRTTHVRHRLTQSAT